MIDKYTKVILTVIAICLVILVTRDMFKLQEARANPEKAVVEVRGSLKDRIYPIYLKILKD